MKRSSTNEASAASSKRARRQEGVADQSAIEVTPSNNMDVGRPRHARKVQSYAEESDKIEEETDASSVKERMTKRRRPLAKKEDRQPQS